MNNRRTTEKTLGNGNCAFNAFILGLELDEAAFPEFTEMAAVALDIENDHLVVKNNIENLKKTNPLLLQEKLGPVLRQLAIILIRKNSVEHLNNTEDKLINAFLNPEGDDVFSVHPQIKAEFEKNKNKSEQEASLALRAWWKSSGYSIFLNNMADEKRKYWAGDLELVTLANYFGVALYIQFRGSDKYVTQNWPYGALASADLSHEVIYELQNRDVVEGPSSHLSSSLPLCEMNEGLLEKRLGSVSLNPNEQNDIIDYFTHADRPLRNKSTPAWSQATLTELHSRKLVCRENGGYVFTSDFNGEANGNEKTLDQAIKRISAIPDKDNIIADWKENYKAVSSIYLTNPNGVHWENMRLMPDSSNEKPNQFGFFSDETSRLDNQWDQIKSTLSALSQTDDLGKTSYSLEPYIRKNGMDISKKILATDWSATSHSSGSDLKTVNYVSYAVGDKEMVVDRITQVLLDHELAKRLQKEEDSARKPGVR